MQLPLLAPALPQHPQTDNAPRDVRVQGPNAGARREVAFSNVMDRALATPGTSSGEAVSEQKDTEGKADDGGSGTSPAIRDWVTGQGASLLVPVMMAPSAVGPVPVPVVGVPASGETPAGSAVAAGAATALRAATPAGYACASTGSADAKSPGLVPAASEANGALGKIGVTTDTPGSVTVTAGTFHTATTTTANSMIANPPITAPGAVAAALPGTTPATARAEATRQSPASNQAPTVDGAAGRAVPETALAARSSPHNDQQIKAAPNLTDTAAVVSGGPAAPLQTPQPPQTHAAFAAQQAAAANAPAFTHPGRLTPQLAGPLFTLARAAPGEHLMTLKVSPENLGALTVRAHIDAAGVRIELFAPGDAGRDAVRTILPELRRGLAESGLGAQLNLSQHGAPQDSGAGNQTSGQRGEPGQHRDPGQQSQPGLRAPSAPDAARPRAGAAVVLSASRAGALDVLA